MSGVLTRLIARGKGTAEPGLSPRIASRFESPVEEWGAVTEALTKTPVAEPATRNSPTIEGSERPASTRESSPEQPSGSMPEAIQPSDSRQGPAPLLPPPPVREAARTKASTPPAASTSDIPSELERPVAPPLLTPETEPEVRVHREANESESGGSTGLTADSSRPPVPLLPPERTPAATPQTSFQVNPTFAPQPGAVPTARQEMTQAPEPPEIVIHIGRIDIRSDPEPRAPAKRRQARPQMTPLGDYLKSRGGTG